MLRLSDTAADRELVRLFPRSFSLDTGISVSSSQRAEPGFCVRRSESGYHIEHDTLSSRHRALAELLRARALTELTRSPAFSFRGLMVDASRGGVPHVEHAKRIIGYCALLGLNYLALYTEDTYEVESQPLLGYLRGAYSRAELSELVAYGKLLGVELFPCIQTLAHLEQLLQYPAYDDVKDTRSVLNVRAKRTPELVRELVAAAHAPYESSFIHVGMDEPWDIGRGKTFDVASPVDPRELYLEQLALVHGICRERGLKMLYWGDVVIGQHSDPAMNREQTARLPKDAEVVFWDYFEQDEGFYARRITQYRDMGYEPFVAPGVWNWDRLWGLYRKCERTAGPLLRAAKRANVSRILMTMWGDDGQECSFASNLPALAFYAEHCFSDDVTDENVDRLLGAITGDGLASFLLPSALDCPDDEAFTQAGNRSKGFLWDDPLLRLYASHFTDLPRLARDYAKIARELRHVSRKAARQNKLLFRFAATLAKAITAKVLLVHRAPLAVQAQDRTQAAAVADTVKTVIALYEKLWKRQRALWLSENKPFGLELIDGRYGAAIARLRVLRRVLRAYASGRLERVVELETKPVRFLGENPVRVRHWRGLANPAYPTWP